MESVLTYVMPELELLGLFTSSEIWEAGFNPSLASLETEVGAKGFCSQTEGNRH